MTEDDFLVMEGKGRKIKRRIRGNWRRERMKTVMR